MRVFLHSEKAEKSKHYVMTVAPAADLGFVLGEVPREWQHPDGSAKQIEVVFEFGAAEVSDQLGAYMVKRDLVKRTRLMRRVARFFDRFGKPLDEVFDEAGQLVLTADAPVSHV